jgi:hypothetical protein
MKKIVKIVLIVAGVYLISPTLVINIYELVKKEVISILPTDNKPPTNFESENPVSYTESTDTYEGANLPSNTGMSVEDVINY